MAESKADALVISDSEGNYYVVPREVLELSKIKSEAKGEVDKQLAERKSQTVDLGAGLSGLGVVRLPEETRWMHYQPDIAWPH